MKVSEAVSSRRSVRAFLDQPVSEQTIRRVLNLARMAPSGCNFQPWEATILTGGPLKALQEVLLATTPDDPLEYDFSAPGTVEKYRNRLRALGQAMAEARGLENGRADSARANMTSFGAPVLLLCHFPKGIMKEPQWSDVGMWLQTIMLLLREEGLDSCAQEYMGMFGCTIKRHLEMDEDVMLFCGLAIGVRDEQSPLNNFARDRVPLDEQATFLGFD